MDATIDVSKLTAEQLRAALAFKEGRVVGNGQKCSFVPKRTDQVPCGETPEFQYGESCYCKKHQRTVQAMNAKKRWEEEKEARDAQDTEQKSETNDPLALEKEGAKQEKEAEHPESPEPEASVEKVPKPLETKVSTSEKKTKSNASRPKVAPVTKKVIKSNKWGRFEDPETGIVFDPKSKAAYGVQDHKTGKVKALTPSHIKICERYSWKYHVIKSAPSRVVVPAVESSEESSNEKEESSEENSSEEQNETEEEGDESKEESVEEVGVEGEDEEIEEEGEDDETEGEEIEEEGEDDETEGEEIEEEGEDDETEEIEEEGEDDTEGEDEYE